MTRRLYMRRVDGPGYVRIRREHVGRASEIVLSCARPLVEDGLPLEDVAEVAGVAPRTLSRLLREDKDAA